MIVEFVERIETRLGDVLGVRDGQGTVADGDADGEIGVAETLRGGRLQCVGPGESTRWRVVVRNGYGAAAAALLSSAPVGVQVDVQNGGEDAEVTREALEGLAWPERAFEQPWRSQLAVLWRRLCVVDSEVGSREAGNERRDERRAMLLESIDRVAAECFELTLSELVELEARRRESARD